MTARMSENVGDLAQALSAFQGECPAIPRTHENPFFKSRYADLADILGAVKGLLATHGLSVTQTVGHRDDRTVLTTLLLHSSGQWVKDEMALFLAKAEPQAQGSAITYARRYALSAALGIASEDDDDGNAATPSEPAHRKASRPPRNRAAAPPPDPAVEEALHDLAELVEGVPAAGRDALKAQLREKFGAPSSMTLDQLREACDIAGSWTAQEGAA